MAETGGKKRPQEPPAVVAARYSGYGLQLAASVGVFMAGGWWLDGKLGTKPLLAVVGALVGGAGGFYSLYRSLAAEKDRESGP